VVTIVLPVFNERPNLAPLLEELAGVLKGVPHEIVAVDDGSMDGSLEELLALSNGSSFLRVLSLERHRGQSAAFAAGFDAARGEYIMTMDADGQNAPEDGLRLLEVVRGDGPATVAVGYRVGRVDGWWRRLQSWAANRVRDRITGDRVRDTGCSLKVMPRAALGRVPRFDGMHRFLPTLLRLAGEQVVEIPVSHRPRRHGRSKYGMWGRVGVGLRDALGVRWYGRRRLDYRVREVGSGEHGEPLPPGESLG
jgi:glycosyltransferase involved in cell wall biosynthesis